MPNYPQLYTRARGIPGPWLRSDCKQYSPHTYPTPTIAIPFAVQFLIAQSV